MELRPINTPEENDYKDLTERYEMAKELVKFAEWKRDRISENHFYYSLTGEARRIEDLKFSNAVVERCQRIARRIQELYFEEETKLGY